MTFTPFLYLDRLGLRRLTSSTVNVFLFHSVCGSDACIEWESEGRRVVPLMPRLVPQTVFTGTATAAANHAASVNAAISSSAKGKSIDRHSQIQLQQLPVVLP